jgi:hypothetical protein
MAGEQNDSDPLPFVQVDRSIDPKAVNFAKLVKIPFDHALGSLVQWFRQNAEPRQLQKVLAETPEGNEARLVLDADALRRRFRVSTGFEVEPLDLVEIGLVEQLDEGFRVRGMSRYFEPLRRRKHRREAGAKGGKASAAARAGGEAPGQADAQAPAQAPAQANGKQEIRDQRTEVRGKRSETPLAGEPKKPRKKPQPTLPGIPEPPPKARALSWQEELYAVFVERRADALMQLGEDEPAPEEHPGPAFVNMALGPMFEGMPVELRAGSWGDLLECYFKSPNAGAKRFPFRYLCAGGVWRKHAREALTAWPDCGWADVQLDQAVTQ